MIVIVCGSRDWTDRDTIRAWLSRLPAGTVIVHGAARGADTLAGEVARELGFEVREYPAQWERPTGTGDMVVRAVAAGVRVTVVPPGVRP